MSTPTRTPLATPPESIDLANYDEVKTLGNVRVGDIMSREFHLLLVTKVTRTPKTVEIRAENENGPAEKYYGRLIVSRHRSGTKVATGLGSFTHIYRKRVTA